MRTSRNLINANCALEALHPPRVEYVISSVAEKSPGLRFRYTFTTAWTSLSRRDASATRAHARFCPNSFGALLGMTGDRVGALAAPTGEYVISSVAEKSPRLPFRYTFTAPRNVRSLASTLRKAGSKSLKHRTREEGRARANLLSRSAGIITLASRKTVAFARKRSRRHQKPTRQITICLVAKGVLR